MQITGIDLPKFLPPPALTPAEQDRFWSKVTTSPGDDCWRWTGGLGTTGYGRISLGGRKGRQWGAHRIAWSLLRGDVPDGLELDHLCRVRSCVNPWHLEPVTHAVNSRRSSAGAVNAARLSAQTHCKRGHEFTPANTRRTRSGSRRCRECDRQASNRRYALNPERRRQQAYASRAQRSA